MRTIHNFQEMDDIDVDSTLLKTAKEFLKENWKKGAVCPCCTQLVKRYSRKINTSMAYGLLLICRMNKTDTIHVEDFLKDILPKKGMRVRGNNVTLLRHWGMLTKVDGTRDDGSKDIGIYIITQKARDFVNNKITVSEHVYLFDNKYFGESQRSVNIKQALGSNFDYDELMSL